MKEIKDNKKDHASDLFYDQKKPQPNTKQLVCCSLS